MNSEGDRIILRIEQREERLQISCFKQETNHPHPVRNFLEQTPSDNTLTEQTQHIQSILCRMNQAGKLTTEAFRQIKGCGQILYDELFPLKIKERLHGLESTFLTLEIDEELNFIPWEFLFDGEDFLCRRFALGRIVHTRQVIDTSRFSIRAKNSPQRMLLLYDPKGDLSQEEGDLFWGEAEKLLTHFDNHPEVRIDLKSRRIERKTIRRYLREYDIVHYAGHADYNEKNPEQSGWELVDGKFVAHDLTKMIGNQKSMPLLVFSNACRSGRVDFGLESDYQKRVFSLARIFLVSGVRHYIGTFWDILNKESAEFASLFYKNLFSGQPIGEALQRARISFSTAERGNTALWSSYILYGDPSISYMAGAENKHIIPSERSETISTPATATIRGTLSDTSGSPVVTAVNEKVKRDITTKVQWGKAAKTCVMVLGISSLVGLILFYFYPKKMLNFLYLQKGNSASAVTTDDNHLPNLVGNGEINSRLIQGDKLIGQGKNQKARALFKQLLNSRMLKHTQTSRVWNRLGQLYTSSHQIPEAIEAFRQSIEADPNLYENYVNHAVLLRDQGDWVAATKSVKKALDRNPVDVIALSLEEELKERLALEKDTAKKQRLDQLIQELSEAFRNKRSSFLTYPSEVQTITFLDFSSKGIVPDRLGESDYLRSALVQSFQDVKDIKVVERVLIDKLLEELKLGSSEIADPAVSVRLGQLLAARCIAIGTIYRFGKESEIALKLIDTETSEILSVLTERITDPKYLRQAVQRLSTKIIKVLEQG